MAKPHLRLAKDLTHLWYRSLENKICHVHISAVGGLYGDDGDTGVGVGALKSKINVQPVLVVGCDWRNACGEAALLKSWGCLQPPLLFRSLDSNTLTGGDVRNHAAGECLAFVSFPF